MKRGKIFSLNLYKRMFAHLATPSPGRTTTDLVGGTYLFRRKAYTFMVLACKAMEVYKMCFQLFRKYRNSIQAVTFWNISDRHSWLDDFPVRNRKDYPLLFDKDLKPKKAFWKW